MKINRTPVVNRRTIFYAVCFLVLTVAVGFFLLSSPKKSAAQIVIPENVPTQGRTLTPAGKLLIDAATNLPAVAPLTVDFVRSPDEAGADGKGRFLIAVNSGFGVQFNAKSKPQQTVSVIDLNQKPEPQIIQPFIFRRRAARISA